MGRAKASDTKKLKQEYEKERKINEGVFLALPLSEEEKDKLVEKVLYDVEQDESARKDFIDKVSEIVDLYEGKVMKEPIFEGAANVSTRIVTMVVEILHSILYPSVWNEDLHYWVPVEATDIPEADAVSKFMSWDSTHNKLKLLISDWVKALILEGTCVTKTRWDERWKWIQKKTVDLKSIVKSVKKVLRTLAGGKLEVEVDDSVYTVEYVPVKRELAATDVIPLEDVGFPPFCNPSMEEEDLDHIWHRTRPYIYEIKEKEDRGFYEPGVTDAVGKCLEDTICNNLDGPAKHRMDAEGSRMVEVRKESTPCEVIEWYGKQEVEGSWEEIVAWVEVKSRKFMAATYLRCLDKFEKRPFKISQLIRRGGRMYGISMGELVKEYQKILDEMQNQNLNAGKLSTMPPGFYRAASGYDPEKVVIQPGIMIPVDDINDVRWFQIPANTLPSHQEMRLIIEMVERIASIGSYQSGQESNIVRTRSTARGTMAIIQQGERRFYVLGMTLQAHLAQVMGDRLRYYQQYLNSETAERILGKDGQLLFPEGLSNDDLAGEYDLKMTLDATGGSKAQKTEISSMIYQNYMANPFTQQDPARLWEVSARPLKEIGEPDVESIIGPKPESQVPGGPAEPTAPPPDQTSPLAGSGVPLPPDQRP